MFISSQYLVINYGIDNTIARFFADREPPADNLYWKEKLLYLRPSPGYLFIPLIIDLLCKLEIDKQQLLSEAFVDTMEQIGHVSALEETRQITKDEAIKKCAELVKANCKNKDWYNSLLDYFNNTKDNFFKSLSTPFDALHRGDAFLFSLAVLQFSEKLNRKIAEQWFALISTLLLLDDAEDLENDIETGDENAFVQSGVNKKGIQKIERLLHHSLEKIRALNPTMAMQLDRQYKELIENYPVLQLKYY